MLFKVQLPLALPTILTGVNQTIMMSLYGGNCCHDFCRWAGRGCAERYYPDEDRPRFRGGIAVVVLAIVLDRITQGMAQNKRIDANKRYYNKNKKGNTDEKIKDDYSTIACHCYVSSLRR